jgi:hypothetical protein
LVIAYFCRLIRKIRISESVFEVCCEHIKSFSELPLKGKSVNEPTGGEVLKGKANASENCDLVLVFTPILDARDYTWLRITENQRDKLPRYGSGLRGRSFRILSRR